MRLVLVGVPYIGAFARYHCVMPFIDREPTPEDYWRAIVLFGRNAASYKFALARSLLEIADDQNSFVKMEDLALPFARRIAEHIGRMDRQATSKSSRFLDFCRQFNRGEISTDALRTASIRLGFVNVIDAFHVVNRDPIPLKFFIDQRAERGGITITDDLLKLKELLQFRNLPLETEARWRL